MIDSKKRESCPEREKAEFLHRCFKSLYPTAADATEGFLSELGLTKVCPRCKDTRVSRQYGSRQVKCRGCGRKSWLTSNTFFHGIKEIEPWFAAIWMKERGAVLKSSHFRNLVGVAQSTAWTIIKKIDLVVLGSMQDSEKKVPTALFSNIFTKRSRETPARKAPAEEQTWAEINWSGEPTDISAHGEPSKETETTETHLHGDGSSFAAEQNSNLSALSEEEQTVLDVVSSAVAPVLFDVISERTKLSTGKISATLITLEINGLLKRLDGDRFTGVTAAEQGAEGHEIGLDPAILKTVSSIVEFTSSCFLGISRKYVQLFIAAFWSTRNDEQWGAGKLLKACLRSQQITDAEVRDYVSPLFVKVALV